MVLIFLKKLVDFTWRLGELRDHCSRPGSVLSFWGFNFFSHLSYLSPRFHCTSIPLASLVSLFTFFPNPFTIQKQQKKMASKGPETQCVNVSHPSRSRKPTRSSDPAHVPLSITSYTPSGLDMHASAKVERDSRVVQQNVKRGDRLLFRSGKLLAFAYL